MKSKSIRQTSIHFKEVKFGRILRAIIFETKLTEESFHNSAFVWKSLYFQRNFLLNQILGLFIQWKVIISSIFLPLSSPVFYVIWRTIFLLSDEIFLYLKLYKKYSKIIEFKFQKLLLFTVFMEVENWLKAYWVL